MFAAQFVDALRVCAPFVSLKGWAKVRLFFRVFFEDASIGGDDVFSTVLVSSGGLLLQLLHKIGAKFSFRLAEAVIIAALGVLRAR